MTIHATLCFIVSGDDQVLLLKKNPGLFGAGKWNAPGGKVKPGESPDRCVVRETREETGLRVQVRRLGLLEFFKYGKREDPDWVGHVYRALRYGGKILKESREGVLKWFPLDQPPFDEMWEDDRYWYNLVIQEREFHGWFYFKGDFQKLADHRLEISPVRLGY